MSTVITKPPPPDATLKVVNIHALAYSGSTWLTLMLGAHSRIFGAGEINDYRGPRGGGCALHGEQCPVWSQFTDGGAENAFVQLYRLTGRPIIAISHSGKFQPDQRHAGIESLYIDLVRDGRAVVASYLRKHPGKTIWRAIRWWKRRQRRSRSKLAGHESGRVLRVRYEQLKADTEGEVRRICRFIGVDFEPGMMEYWLAEQHYVGGNLGTLHALARQGAAALPESTVQKYRQPGRQWDMSHYDKATPRQFSDERWRKELGRFQLAMFDLFAGRMNAALGYERGEKRAAKVQS